MCPTLAQCDISRYEPILKRLFQLLLDTDHDENQARRGTLQLRCDFRNASGDCRRTATAAAHDAPACMVFHVLVRLHALLCLFFAVLLYACLCALLWCMCHVGRGSVCKEKPSGAFREDLGSESCCVVHTHSGVSLLCCVCTPPENLLAVASGCLCALCMGW